MHKKGAICGIRMDVPWTNPGRFLRQRPSRTKQHIRPHGGV